jgi:hypothetical protein
MNDEPDNPRPGNMALFGDKAMVFATTKHIDSGHSVASAPIRAGPEPVVIFCHEAAFL